MGGWFAAAFMRLRLCFQSVVKFQRTDVPYRTIGVPVRWVAKGVEGRTYRTGAYRDGITIPLSGDGTFWYGRYAPMLAAVRTMDGGDIG